MCFFLPRKSLDTHEHQHNKVFLEDIPGLTIENAFRIDRTSDVNNVTYGSLYRMHIAKHRRFSEHCLGLNTGSKIKENKNKEVRYFAKENRKLLANSGIQSLVQFSSTLLSLSDYVKLPSNTANANIQPDNYSVLSSEKSSKTNDSSEVTVDEQLRRSRMRTYNQHLLKKPHDVDVWLEFIKYHDELNYMHAPASTVSEVEKCKLSENAVYEIKEAVFKRAIENNPGNVKLIVAQLHEFQNYWDIDKLNAEWKNLLFNHVNDAQLWKQYLRFQRNKFANFSINKLLKEYSRCLVSLKGVLEGKQLSHPPQPGTTSIMIGNINFCITN